MYLIVETENRALIAMAGGDKRFALACAKYHAKLRGKAVRVRDTEARGAIAIVYTMRPESLERRRAADCPPKCFGAEKRKHAIKCRPARPACRWRRRERGLCTCVAYHFPHRSGSGRCIERDGGERYEIHLRTARRRAA